MALPDHIEKQLNEMRQQVELMRSLATRSGFFKQYFKELARKEQGKPVHRTNYECFNHLNTVYFDLFGEYKYSTYNSFHVSYTNYLHSK